MIFLWENIYSYQKELKETLVEGINKQIFKNIKVETHMIIIFKME